MVVNLCGRELFPTSIDMNKVGEQFTFRGIQMTNLIPIKKSYRLSCVVENCLELKAYSQAKVTKDEVR